MIDQLVNVKEVVSGIYAITPEIFLLFSGLFLLMGVVFFKSLNSVRVSYFAFIAVLVATLFHFYNHIYFFNLSNTLFFSNTIFINQKTIYVKYAILILSMVSCLLFSQYWKTRDYLKPEIIILSMFAIVGMMFMVSSNGLITLYLSLELSALSLYICVSADSKDSNASEAGLKYFILSSLASAIFLFGASFIYGTSGSTNFAEILNFNHNNVVSNSMFDSYSKSVAVPILFILGVMMVFTAICFKLSIFPFHSWAPDLYQGSNIVVSSIVATISKVAAVFVLLELVYHSFYLVFNQIFMILAIFAGISVFIGTISAVNQKDLKRFIAYSGISHMGFILFGILSKSGDLSLKFMMFYILVYAVINIGLFGSLSSLTILKNDNTKYSNSFDMKYLSGLSKKNPLFAFCVAICMFSLAGIPPFIGFFAKFNILYLIIKESYYLIAIYLVIFSVISCYYYLKIIKLMYFDEYIEENQIIFNNSSIINCLMYFIIAFNILFVFIYF